MKLPNGDEEISICANFPFAHCLSVCLPFLDFLGFTWNESRLIVRILGTFVSSVVREGDNRDVSARGSDQLDELFADCADDELSCIFEQTMTCHQIGSIPDLNLLAN
jgi:hypothetical protein